MRTFLLIRDAPKCLVDAAFKPIGLGLLFVSCIFNGQHDNRAEEPASQLILCDMKSIKPLHLELG
jgi:hypothetical protein